ncbi:MAG TPA: LapA family protein [Spirochaetia bacterium]|nr:LapA family protein [Spirochaetia bacterium]
MVRIVVSVILLVALALLVIWNQGTTATINIFGAKVQSVPVVAIALLSFAIGVVYSLFLYIAQYLHGRKRKALDAKDKAITERERALHAREEEAKRGAEKPAAGSEGEEGPERRSAWKGVARFLGGGKEKGS